MRLKEYYELYAFNRWANARVLEAAAQLTPEQFVRDLGNSFPSVRDTLVHILSAEWIWLRRWKGTSPRSMPEEWKPFGIDELRRQWKVVEVEQAEFIAAVSEAQLDREIRYTNTRGESFSYPLWQMLRHVVNHSTYHRGQVITMLRQLGATPVSTDLLRFYDQRTTRA